MTTTSRRTLLVLTIGLATALAAAPVLGQGPPPPGEPVQGRAPDPERMLEHLTRQLDLSEEQVPRVRTILDERAGEMRTLREELGSPGEMDEEARAEFGQRARAIGDGTDARLAEVLTREQMEKYLSLRQQHRRGLRRGAGGPPPPEIR